jgi:hypothetical protein
VRCANHRDVLYGQDVWTWTSDAERGREEAAVRSIPDESLDMYCIEGVRASQWGED